MTEPAKSVAEIILSAFEEARKQLEQSKGENRETLIKRLAPTFDKLPLEAREILLRLILGM